MRIDPKTAAAYAVGASSFLLIFGVGWPGPGTWLLVFSLLLIAAGAAAWWLDGAMVAPSGGAGVLAGRAAGSPFGAPSRPGRGAGRRGDSLLLSLGLPGPDGNGRWVLPDRVHLTALAGAIGALALIIFIAGALSGGGDGSAATETPQQSSPAIDFAEISATPQPALNGAPLPPGAALPAADPSPTQSLPAADPFPIVVDTPTTPEPAPARPLDAPSTLPTLEESVVHEVVPGDTVYDLAITYESSIDAILDANGLNEFATINVGDRLIIPAVENSGAAE